MIKIATQIVKKLREAGHRAYFVGGCVRDLLSGVKDPKDIDIATSAHPEEIEKLFPKTKPVGKEFGVILVIENGKSFEVATFREDIGYEDSRHPQKVIFADEKTDATRRDFTINGIFYDPIKKEVLDYVGGQKDLNNKILRFIGDPYERIREDNLRLLRAIRFKNILGFEYDEHSREAIVDNASLIKNISTERIRDELDKILADKSRSKSLRELDEFGILKLILPEIEVMKGVQQPKNFHSEGDVFVHTLLTVEKLPAVCPVDVAWATLLHDVAKPDTFKIREGRFTFYGHVKQSGDKTEKILERLKFPTKRIEKICWLIRKHLAHHDIPKMKIARARRLLQEPNMADLFLVLEADAKGSLPVGDKMVLVEQVRTMYEEEKKRPKPIKPFLDGTEIMKILNIPPSKEVGKILESLVDAQLEEKVKNRDQAIDYIKNKI